MLRQVIACAVLCLFVSSTAWAQKPVDRSVSAARPAIMVAEKTTVKPQATVSTISPGDLKATPEMWFYEQYMRRYQDTKAVVRANAEFKALQRQKRLASMQWFGFSNSRPRASSDPYNGDSSPTWVGNSSTFYPSRWSGVGQATVYVEQPAQSGAN